MGDSDQIEQIVEALKAEKVAVSEPVVETPPAEADKLAVEEAKKPEDTKPTEVPVSERLQARLDGLTERVYEKEKRIQELEKKLEAAIPAATKEPSDEEVQALLSDPNQAQYHGWAANELARRASVKAEKNILQKMSLQGQIAQSYEAAKTEFPEMSDQKSELWQKANEIYIAKGLERDPDGQYMAAVLAAKELNRNAPPAVSAEVTEKKLAKETAKRGLATVSAKAVVSNDDKLAKLEKEAFSAGKDSPQFMAYIGAIESDRLAKKNKK